MNSIFKVSSRQQITNIARLACEIWREHYTPIIGPEQVDYMLEKFQSEKAVTEQLAGGYEYFTVSHDNQLAGYMAIIPDEEKASVMLSKIYVKKSARGHGLGKKMLKFVEDICRQRNFNIIWLTVNKNNKDSIAWYSRMGFVIAEPIVQDIGNGFVMDDFLMKKKLLDGNSSANPT